MSGITTHVLDVSLGRPASGVRVELLRLASPGASGASVDPRASVDPDAPGHSDTPAEPTRIAAVETDAQGRAVLVGPTPALEAGRYRMTFETGAYFAARGQPSIYPSIAIVFDLREPASHYHLPLLVSPFGYTTYRGS